MYMIVSGVVALAREPDERVDVLRPELQPAAPFGPRHQVLPGEGHRVGGVEAAGEPDVLESVGLLRAAAELPLASRASETSTPASPSNSSRYAWPRAVGVRLGEGELGVHVEQRRRGGRLGHQLVQDAGEPRRLEVELGVDPADEVGRRLEARAPGG